MAGKKIFDWLKKMWRTRPQQWWGVVEAAVPCCPPCCTLPLLLPARHPLPAGARSRPSQKNKSALPPYKSGGEARSKFVVKQKKHIYTCQPPVKSTGSVIVMRFAYYMEHYGYLTYNDFFNSYQWISSDYRLLSRYIACSVIRVAKFIYD